MDSNYWELKDNVIDSTAIIDPSAIIGSGNTIGAYCVIRSCVIIGNNNYIGPHVVIGEPAEYRIHPKNTYPPRVIIGNKNRISEFVAIQSGILTDSTIIGDENYIMHGCHIAHDNKIGNKITIAPLVCIGGSVILEDFSNIGMGVMIHPRLIIGKGAMIGMNATVTKNVPEWETWVGTPAKFQKINTKGIERYNNNL